MLTDAIRLFVFPALMAIAVSSDLFTMTISKWVSLALATSFLVLAPLSNMSLVEFGWHLTAGILVLAVTFGFFTQGWIGGGDAKLAAATALWFGFEHFIDYLLCASIFGGILTLLLIEFRKHPLPSKLTQQPWLQRLHETGGGVPYGIALGAAALLVYPMTEWMSPFSH